jgi:hypothetical protein
MLYNNDLIERPADHPSLVIDTIVLNNAGIPLRDTVRRFHPFSDINNIRPTWLGMHKRLTSIASDGLTGYDIAYAADSGSARPLDTLFDPGALTVNEPPANYAKSGTTDDVIRPFNVDVTSKKRTNYGLWNAVLRVDLAKFSADTAADIRDITVICVGECNAQYTGYRDGKTLHKSLTAALLKRAGIPCPAGFYKEYEEYLKRVTPEAMKNCGLPGDTTGAGSKEGGD